MKKEKDISSSIGKSIRAYRNKKGYSQDKLSKLANMSLHTIAKIESGETPNPTIETVRRIASSLDISVDVLINHPKT